MSPLISVVIPTYNHARYVLETLDSVFAQTYADYEVIVINDGSPDDTAARLRPLAEAGRIRYHEQPNAGQSAARNRGLSLARGEFVAFLDDDALWPPGKLAWQVAAVCASPDAGVVYGQVIELGDDRPHPPGDAPEGEVFERFLDAGWIQSPGQALIRRRVLEQVGGFDPAIWGTDDWDLWLRLARTTRFCYQPQPALVYRRHAANASKDFVRMWKNGHAVVRKHLGGHSAADRARQYAAARAFVDDFTADDGLLHAEQLTEERRLGAAARALLQVWRIRRFRPPSRLYVRAWYRWLRRCLLPPPRAGRSPAA